MWNSVLRRMKKTSNVDRDRKLLQYFSGSIGSPAWGSVDVMQQWAAENACTLPETTLFPPTLDRRKAANATTDCPGLYTRAAWKGPDPRVLSNRFSNCWESRKDFGGTEVAEEDMNSAVQRMWAECGRAWREVTTVPMPDIPSKAVLLIASSVARHKVGNGDGLLSIASEIKRVVESSRNIQFFRDVFQVLCICIGIHSWEGSSGTNDKKSSHIFFPRGGLYSLQSAVNVACGLPDVVGPAGTEALSPIVCVLSDGWIHPRSCAALCSSRTRHVNVLPAVVTNTLSERETLALSRYVSCRLVHAIRARSDQLF